MARTGRKHPEPGIGANVRLRWKGGAVLQEPEALRDHVGHGPDLVLCLPRCAASQQKLTRGFCGVRDAQRDEGSLAGGDGCGLGKQFNRGVPGEPVGRDAVANADEIGTMSSCKALGAILVGGVGLGHAQPLECCPSVPHGWPDSRVVRKATFGALHSWVLPASRPPGRLILPLRRRAPGPQLAADPQPFPPWRERSGVLVVGTGI